MTEKDNILATFEDYAATYCAKDLDGLMAVFDDDSNISMIGTGTDEICETPQEIAAVFERNFKDATAIQFEWHWRQVTITGDAAVVAATLTIHLKTSDGPMSVPIRWTVGLVKRPGGWKWTHRHASAAAGGQKSGSAYPTT